MKKILIVEDEQWIASMLERGLQRKGFSTTVVSDGEQAMQTIQNSTYALILLDLGLPLKNGWTVLKEMREQGNECPVIVMTASGFTRQELLAAGADDYLSKPFQVQTLLDVIQAQIKP